MHHEAPAPLDQKAQPAGWRHTPPAAAKIDFTPIRARSPAGSPKSAGLLCRLDSGARDNSRVLQRHPFSIGPIVAIVDSSHCDT